MMIRADLTNPDEHLALPFEDAIKRWPWLISYRNTLAAGAAVFWGEGQFYLDKPDAA